MLAAIKSKPAPDKLLEMLAAELNSYKVYVDVDLIFDSPDDFLYHQKVVPTTLDLLMQEEALGHRLGVRLLR